MKPPPALLAQALDVLNHAYAPYSQFKVGACIKTSEGLLFNGCNVENAAYNLCICAESNAITKMVSNGQYSIHEILITSSAEDLCFPCGACLQRISEFADNEALIHLYSSTGVYKCITLGEALPYSFNKDILE